MVLRYRSSTTKGVYVDLSDIDGLTIAIVVDLGGSSEVIRGTARCEFDEILGKFIRVRFPDEGQPDDSSLIFYEQDASYRITRDDEYGCDLCVRLTAAPPDATSGLSEKPPAAEAGEVQGG